MKPKFSFAPWDHTSYNIYQIIFPEKLLPGGSSDSSGSGSNSLRSLRFIEIPKKAKPGDAETCLAVLQQHGAGAQIFLDGGTTFRRRLNEGNILTHFAEGSSEESTKRLVSRNTFQLPNGKEYIPCPPFQFCSASKTKRLDDHISGNPCQ